MKKFDNLEIVRFRGLKNIELKNLSNINIFVGENNSGKTSILEAVQLLSNPSSKLLIKRIANQREGARNYHIFNEIEFKEMLRCFFPRMGEKNQPIELILSVNGKRTPVVLELSEEEFIRQYLSGDVLESSDEEVIVQQEVSVKVDNKTYSLTFSDDTNELLPRKDELDGQFYKTSYISAIDHKTHPISATQIGKLTLKNKKSELITLLQQFDNAITGIEIIPTTVLAKNSFPKEISQIYVERNRSELIPLFAFGDGLQKVMIVASKILSVQGGVLLIDEVEIGIHTKMISFYFKWLSELARKYDVTLFLTTHSLETVDGLLSSNDDELLNDLSFYRLEEDKAKYFSGKRMYQLRYNFGQDVRN